MGIITTLAVRLLAAAGVSVSPFLIDVALAAVLALSAGAGAVVWHHQIYESGYQRALSDIAKADAKAVDRASAMRNVWRDCHDAGREWDQTTGKCS